MNENFVILKDANDSLLNTFLIKGGKKMRYGVAVFPSKEVQDEANSYRMRYDPHYALIQPHMTVKEPFEVNEKELDTIISTLNDIAKVTKPFPLKVSKVSSFAPVTNTIYLKVEPVEALLNLTQTLHQDPLPNKNTYPFVPHITIGQKLSNDEFSDVFGSLRIQQFDIEEPVEEMQLVYQLEDGSWAVHDTFKFGKE